MDEAQSAEAPRAASDTAEVRQLDPERIADGHVLDTTCSRYERTDPAADLPREFGQLARELRRHQRVARESALVEVPETTKLARLETVGLTVEFGDCLPLTGPAASASRTPGTLLLGAH